MKSYLTTKDFAVTNEIFELFLDEKRDILITRPKPKNSNKYYDSDNYISHTDAKRTFFEQLYHYVKTYSLSRKVALVKKYSNGRKSLLDIGSGTGDFLMATKSKGWFIAGVEPNEHARNRSFEKGAPPYASLKDLKALTFDVVTLWHVLEHVPDLEGNIDRIHQLLDYDGTLIVAVPNYKSWDARHYKSYWAAYDVPRHLWHFSKTAIENIFSEHGFKLIKTKPMWFDAFYVSILSERYKESKAAFLKGSLYGLWSNIWGLITKEYSSQIYILKKTEN